MIYTVTLNPCIDRTYTVEKLNINRVNRSLRSRTDYSGKGLNVSITLSVLGTKSIATGFFGENDKYAYNETLTKYGIDNAIFYREGSTRINTKIVDISTMEQTDVSEYGTFVSKTKVLELESFLRKNINEGDIVVFSGSVPPKFEFESFCSLTDLVTFKNSRLIVDSERERLAYGIKNRAFLVKPNIYEFKDYLNKDLNNLQETAGEAYKIAKAGVSNVIVSMGGDGCLFANEKTVVYSKPINVPLVSTTGAGDAVVAGFLHAFSEGAGFEDCAKSAAAASSACVMTEGTLPPEKKTYDKLLSKVQLQRII